MTAPASTPLDQNKKTRRILILAAFAMLCVGLSTKPLYDTFCRITGYGGTAKISDARSSQMIDRGVTVRFDANVQSDLPWEFKPEVRTVDVKLGQTVLAYYTAKNLSSLPTTGSANFNVMPVKAAPFFTKVECFCFTEQLLQPGEEVRMPVMFYVDPRLAEEARAQEVEMITLSYTFNNIETPSADVVSTAEREKKRKSLEAEMAAQEKI